MKNLLLLLLFAAGCFYYFVPNDTQIELLDKA
jgi:hypothetical protein